MFEDKRCLSLVAAKRCRSEKQYLKKASERGHSTVRVTQQQLADRFHAGGKGCVPEEGSRGAAFVLTGYGMFA